MIARRATCQKRSFVRVCGGRLARRRSHCRGRPTPSGVMLLISATILYLVAPAQKSAGPPLSAASSAPAYSSSTPSFAASSPTPSPASTSDVLSRVTVSEQVGAMRSTSVAALNGSVRLGLISTTESSATVLFSTPIRQCQAIVDLGASTVVGYSEYFERGDWYRLTLLRVSDSSEPTGITRFEVSQGTTDNALPPSKSSCY